MLGNIHAPGYFTHLLRFDERNFQLVFSNGVFLLLHPVVQNVHPITYIGNCPAESLDSYDYRGCPALRHCAVEDAYILHSAGSHDARFTAEPGGVG